MAECCVLRGREKTRIRNTGFIFASLTALLLLVSSQTHGRQNGPGKLQVFSLENVWIYTVPISETWTRKKKKISPLGTPGLSFTAAVCVRHAENLWTPLKEWQTTIPRGPIIHQTNRWALVLCSGGPWVLWSALLGLYLALSVSLCHTEECCRLVGI